MIAHMVVAASLLATAPARDVVHDEPDPIAPAEAIRLVCGLAGTRDWCAPF